MEMEEVLTAISTVGFPIVAVIGLAFFIYKVWAKTQENMQNQIQSAAELNRIREEKLYEQIDKFNATLSDFNSTLISIDKRLELIEYRVDKNEESKE